MCGCVYEFFLCVCDANTQTSTYTFIHVHWVPVCLYIYATDECTNIKDTYSEVLIPRLEPFSVWRERQVLHVLVSFPFPTVPSPLGDPPFLQTHHLKNYETFESNASKSLQCRSYVCVCVCGGVYLCFICTFSHFIATSRTSGPTRYLCFIICNI